MLFRDERVLFATEFLADALVTTNPRSLPSACSAFDRHPLAEWIRSYRTVEALDFDRVAPGHGDMFGKAVVAETREYFEYLVAQVSAGIRAGRPLTDLVETHHARSLQGVGELRTAAAHERRGRVPEPGGHALKRNERRSVFPVQIVAEPRL